MRTIAISLLLLLVAVSAEAAEMSVQLLSEDWVLESRLLTVPPTKLVSRVTRDEVARSPAWQKGTEQPPLSPLKARDLALAQLGKTMPQRSWGMPDITLKAFDVTQGPGNERDLRWIYLLRFSLLSPRANEGGWTDIVVLMNGKAIEPERAGE